MSGKLVGRANRLAIIGLIILIALIGALGWERLQATRSSRDWIDHTHQVIDATRQLGLAVREAEDGQRGFVLTASPAELTAYDEAVGRASVLLGDLQRLTSDNPRQQARLHVLAPQWQRRLQQLAEGVQIRRDSGLQVAAATASSETTRATSNTIAVELATMTAEEQRLLTQRLDDLDTRGKYLQLIVTGGWLIAVAGLLLALRLINRAWRQATVADERQSLFASRLSTALDSLSQGVAVFGPRHRLRHWNRCFHIVLGIPESLMRDRTPYQDFVTQIRHDGLPVLESEPQIAANSPSNGDPVVYERELPGARLLEIRRTPTPEGGFVLTLSDMTKRAESEALLREAQKMQAIGQLTGGIAHDFNNLLTVILGNLELARGKLDAQSPLVNHIERALWAAQRGGTLTSQLLAFARKQPLAPTPIDLSATVQDMIPLLRRTLGEHIDVRFVDSAGLWAAMADPAQLESAILNLALNARDAMSGGGRLTVELANKVLDSDYARRHAEVTPGDYVMVAVSDSGHGMTPEIVARVFEPFFTTKAEGRGSGLGLAMVFGFVKQSGGHVKVYSEPDEGTSVKIYLPRAIGVTAAALQRSGMPADLPAGSATILVVEDEGSVREIAVAILRSLGYRVLEAIDGEDALRVFGAHASEVDMLLTDVVLPGKVRGRELAERVLELRPEVKLLFMSGYTENSIVHHGRLDDGVQLLSKPFKREQLARKVAEVLGTVPGHDAGGLNIVDLRGRSGR